MKIVDDLSRLHRAGKDHLSFLQERYWERDNWLHAPKPWMFKDKRCISRAKVLRAKHEPDKDGRCIFCDYLDPTFPA